MTGFQLLVLLLHVPAVSAHCYMLQLFGAHCYMLQLLVLLFHVLLLILLLHAPAVGAHCYMLQLFVLLLHVEKNETKPS